MYGGNGGPNGMRVWNNLADARAGTAARGTTFYQDAQGQYVERWSVPAGAEDVARGIVDNAQHDYGPSYADVTNDNFSQLMTTYIAKYGADSSNFQGPGEAAAGLGLAGSLIKQDVSAVDGVALVNGRVPINSKYAGQMYPTDSLSPELQAKYPLGVQFTPQGFPNFTPYAKAEAEIDGLTGNYGVDAAMANKAVGLQSTPQGYVWHHVEDGNTMQLIPQDLHNAVRHTGGAAVIKGGN
ncbi:HNH endonuclease [Paraburkholderia aspalathi]|uniref:HNH endonuclease n=2 Tax=Paraburkholderia aspalathi TaxID=1324617 RepID=UPI0038BB9FD1